MKNEKNEQFSDAKVARMRAHRRSILQRKQRGLENKGYSEAGASTTKKAMKGFRVQSGSVKEDIDLNQQTLRTRSRILYYSSPIATSAIKTNRTNVIGEGLKLKSHIDKNTLGISDEQAESTQKEIEKEFALWAEDKRACDATGMNNFAEMQQLAMMSWLMSGDVFALITFTDTTILNPYGLKIQLIEADRICTPTDARNVNYVIATEGINQQNGNAIYDGVEVDKNGRVVAYWISEYFPNETFTFTKGPNKWTRVQAYQSTGLPNIVHLMDSERPDQYRGISYLAQIIEPLLQTRRYTESELMAAIVESFFTAFVTTNEDPDDIAYNEVNPDEEIDQTKDEYQMGPATINMMEPGEDIKFANPTRPASGFDAFMKSITTQIGAALEIPRDLLMKEFNSSYSASRAALLEAWKSFRMRRKWFADDFCKPIYEVWLSEAIARGRISAPGFFTDPRFHKAYLRSEWIGPSQGQLDPVKEINAEVLALQHGFTTHEQATIKLNGGSWEDNAEQLARENKIIPKSSDEIKDDDSEEGEK